MKNLIKQTIVLTIMLLSFSSCESLIKFEIARLKFMIMAPFVMVLFIIIISFFEKDSNKKK